ncbi:MAG: YdbC family protein [Fusobacteriaceae bacterium]
MAEIKFDILEKLGVIGESSKGWTREVNVVSWNNRKGKIDIRDWDEHHEKMGKGITLSKEELKALKEILDGIDIDEMDVG